MEFPLNPAVEVLPPNAPPVRVTRTISAMFERERRGYSARYCCRKTARLHFLLRLGGLVAVGILNGGAAYAFSAFGAAAATSGTAATAATTAATTTTTAASAAAVTSAATAVTPTTAIAQAIAAVAVLDRETRRRKCAVMKH